ncbi:MAG: uroporphyrinogen decarboxylase family protein [Armatimonadota bacterium]
MTSLERTANIIAGKPVDHLPNMPIFMIWAAQRYGYSYEDYVRDYRVLGECQLRLVEDFALDILQLISDPVRETADCGAELVYYDDGPPRTKEYILADKGKFVQLQRPNPTEGRMGDRVAGARFLRERAGDEYPIMGWVEGPIAEAVDMRGMTDFMMDLVTDIEFARDLMDWIVPMEIDFARAQVEAGCHMIGMGDAAASLISPELYYEEVLPRERQIIEAIHEAGAIARLHICGNTNHILRGMEQTGCEIIDLDHLVVMENARPEMGGRPVLLGNFDPVEVLKDSSPETVYGACRRCHEWAGDRYIIGPGCEVPPGTPEENIRAMINYARDAEI